MEKKYHKQKRQFFHIEVKIWKIVYNDNWIIWIKHLNPLKKLHFLRFLVPYVFFRKCSGRLSKAENSYQTIFILLSVKVLPFDFSVFFCSDESMYAQTELNRKYRNFGIFGSVGFRNTKPKQNMANHSTFKDSKYGFEGETQGTLGRFTTYWTITDCFTSKWLKNWWEMCKNI